jgi:hypothetical protein
MMNNHRVTDTKQQQSSSEPLPEMASAGSSYGEIGRLDPLDDDPQQQFDNEVHAMAIGYGHSGGQVIPVQRRTSAFRPSATGDSGPARAKQ